MDPELVEGKVALRDADGLGEPLEPASPLKEDVAEGWWAVARAELRALGLLAAPIMLASVLQMALDLITIGTAAHIGVEELAGVGLARILANCSGIAPILGIIMAMDTLATQAHGAERHHLVGELAQRAALIVTVACIPVIALWWNIGPLLLLLGQDPTVVPKAAGFLRILSFGLVPLLLNEVMKKYLQAQGIVYPVPCMTAVVVLVHAATSYTLTWSCGLGLTGCALAQALSWTLLMVLTLLYTMYAGRCLPRITPKDPLDCWAGWTRRAWAEWGLFMKLGVPSAFLLCLDWWSFELLMLQAGILGVPSLAAANITMQLIAFLFMAPLGLSIATSVRVGQALGAGAVEAAQSRARVSIVTSASLCTLNGLFVLFCLPLWSAAFTTDPTVTELIAKLHYPLVLLIWVDDLAVGIVGVLRGTGLQKWGAGINFLFQWGVGLSLAAVAAFVWHFGVLGLFSGLTLGLMFVPLLDGIILARADWVKLAVTARARAGCVDDVEMAG